MFTKHERLKKMNNDKFLKKIEEGIKGYLPDAQIVVPNGALSNHGYDCVFNLVYPGHISIRVVAEFKRNLRPSTFFLIESRFVNVESSHKMLVSDYITPTIADKLREKKIWFLDEAGNIYIEVPGRIFILNTGNKRKTSKKHFPFISTANSKVFFYLLKKGPKIEASYRHLAKHAGVSLGKISQAVGELQHRQIIHTQKNGILIRQPLRLLESWVQSYLEKLKPQVYRGTYTWPYDYDFSKLDGIGNHLNKKIAIGGERAGELFTGYLKAASMDLWVEEENISDLKNSLKLMESSNGFIRIYSFFSNDIFFENEKDKDIKLKLVHPLIVYADLMGIPDTRCHETAQMLKENRLGWIQ
jgi:hypothetical protein